jgi:hypothetical protein
LLKEFGLLGDPLIAKLSKEKEQKDDQKKHTHHPRQLKDISNDSRNLASGAPGHEC